MFGMSPYSSSTYQGTVMLGPFANFDYAAYVIANYPQHKYEPMVGFKILLVDTKPSANPFEKEDWIINEIQRTNILAGRNVILREGDPMDLNSYYLISLPVPRSMLAQQLNNISYVLQTLQLCGLHRRAYVQINVSGRVNIYDSNNLLSSIIIPPDKQDKIIRSSSLALGQVVPINSEYSILKTEWNIQDASVFSEMALLAQLISSCFNCVNAAPQTYQTPMNYGYPSMVC